MGIDLPADPISSKFPDLGSVISAALPYVYLIAGLILFANLVMGGITLMTAAGDQAKTKQGYGMLTAGLVGFLIVFVSYFVLQIVQVILGIQVM